MSADFKAFIHFEITGEKKARALQDALAEVGVGFEYAKDSAGKLSAALDGLSTKKLKDVEEVFSRIKGEWGKKFGPMHAEGFKVLSSGAKPRLYKNQIIEAKKAAEEESKIESEKIHKISMYRLRLKDNSAKLQKSQEREVEAEKNRQNKLSMFLIKLKEKSLKLDQSRQDQEKNITHKNAMWRLKLKDNSAKAEQADASKQHRLSMFMLKLKERSIAMEEARQRRLQAGVNAETTRQHRLSMFLMKLRETSERLELARQTREQNAAHGASMWRLRLRANSERLEQADADRQHRRGMFLMNLRERSVAAEEARQRRLQAAADAEAARQHRLSMFMVALRERSRRYAESMEERERNDAHRTAMWRIRLRERSERIETQRLQRELNDRQRRIRAFYTATQRMQAMMRGGGGGGGGILGGFPIVRLFIFDSIRRMITGLHQAVATVGQAIAGWVVDGIKFNDEMKRAQTYFASLGLIGMKGALGGQITIAEARASKDPEISNAFKKSEEISKRMVTKMMEISAQTGQDLQEIITAARQSASDLLNKMNKPGQPNAFLQKPEVIEDITTRLVKLSSVLRMADPQNRKLGFHLVGLQEFFSGTSGSPKSEGASLAISLMRREGLKVGKQFTSEIAKAVNSGDIKKAMDILEEVLTSAGVGIEQIANFMDETLQPSIDSTIMMLKRFNMEITSGITNDSLRAFFAGLKNYLLYLSNQESVMQILSRVSIVLNNALWGLSRRITETVDRLMQNPDFIETTMLNMTKTIESSIGLALSVFEAAGAFMAGLFNGDMSGSIDNISTRIQENLPFFYALGHNFTQLASAVIDNIVIIVRFILMINAVIIAINIIIGVLSIVAGVISLVALGFLPLVGGALLAVAAIATLAAVLVGIAGWIGWNAPDWMANLATNPFQELAANIPQVDQVQVSEDISEAVQVGVATGSSQAVEQAKKSSKDAADKKFAKIGRANPFDVPDAIKRLQSRVPGAMPIPDPKTGRIDPFDRASVLAKVASATQSTPPLISNNRAPNQVEVKKRTEIKDQRQIIQISGPITIKTDDPKGFMDKLSELGRRGADRSSGFDPDFNASRLGSDLNFGVLQ